jgi:hypothetical protein
MPLHGIDHATTIRAIADIWFPRQQQLLLDRGAAFSSMTANVESSPRDKSQNRPDNAKPGCRENRRENCELIYRNQSGDRCGDRLCPDGRRRYGPGLAKASASD